MTCSHIAQLSAPTPIPFPLLQGGHGEPVTIKEAFCSVLPYRCRANMSRIRQSRPDSGFCCKINVSSCSLFARKRIHTGQRCQGRASNRHQTTVDPKAPRTESLVEATSVQYRMPSPINSQRHPVHLKGLTNLRKK